MTTAIELEPNPELTYRLANLPIRDIIRDEGLQSRAAFDAKQAAEYAALMKLGEPFPSLAVFEGHDDRHGSATLGQFGYWLASGFHRIAAHEQNGRQSASCRIYQGTVRHAVLFSVAANAKHGMRRKPEDLRRAARILLSDREWVLRSDRWIAEQVKVHPTVIANVRREMAMEAELERRAAASPSDPLSTVDSGVVSVLLPGEEDGAGSSQDDECVADAARTDGQRREARDRYGGTRLMQTDSINAGRTYQRKPVHVETETAEIARRMAQVVRSIPKAVVQAKALGWSQEKFVAECRLVWEQIPVEQ